MVKNEKKTTKEEQEMFDFMKLSFDTIKDLLDKNLPNVHIADKVYWIAKAVAINHPNEVSMMWSMDAIIDAFDQEIEEWSTAKTKVKNSVSEKLNVFKNKFDNVSSLNEKTIETVN